MKDRPTLEPTEEEKLDENDGQNNALQELINK